MSVQELEQEVQGLSRENRFRLQFSLPIGIPGEIRTITALVMSTNTPGKTRGTITIFRDGKPIRIAGDTNPDETFPVSFKVPKDAKKLYNTMYQWYELPDTSDDYKVDMRVEQLDTQNQVVYTWNIKGVWLSVLPPIAYNTESQDTVTSFEATFSMDDVVPVL